MARTGNIFQPRCNHYFAVEPEALIDVGDNGRRFLITKEREGEEFVLGIRYIITIITILIRLVP